MLYKHPFSLYRQGTRTYLLVHDNINLYALLGFALQKLVQSPLRILSRGTTCVRSQDQTISIRRPEIHTGGTAQGKATNPVGNSHQ